MNIFVLDPDQSIDDFYKNFFRVEFPKVELRFFRSSENLFDTISYLKPDLVLTEFEIPNPFNVFNQLQSNQICFIVVSRIFSERIIVESLKHGAYDYIHKSNLKFDYFKNILIRAFLDLPRWQKINTECLSIQTFPEYQKYDESLKNLALESLQTSANIDPTIPVFVEGKTYILNFLTVRIPIYPELLSYFVAEEELQRMHAEWLKKAINIIEQLNGIIWIRKSDAFTAVFPQKDYLRPILASLEIKAYIVQVLSNLDISELKILCAIEQGSVVYSKDKENLYTEAINLTYHMVERLPSQYYLYITENIYKMLDPRTKKYFFKEENPFEGRAIYHFEYIS